MLGLASSEGLGLSAACMDKLLHCDFDDATWEACGAQNFLVTASLIEDGRHKRERVEIYEPAASVLGVLFKRVHQLTSDAVGSYCWRDPELPQLAALSPRSSNGSTNDFSVRIFCDDVKGMRFGERCSGGVVFIEPCDNGCDSRGRGRGMD